MSRRLVRWRPPSRFGNIQQWDEPASFVIIIESPTEGAYLPPTFTVSGRGGGLHEGNVVVQARDLNGRILLEQATTLQGNNVGTGGEGTWSLQMTINQTVDGEIVAFSPNPAYVEDRVSVRYNSNGTSPGQTCRQRTSSRANVG